MTRPTILDLDLVVVPREAAQAMLNEVTADDQHEPFSDKTMSGVFNSMISASPYPTAWDDVRKYVEELERSNEMWRRNSIDTKAAMTAMRNDINQHVPLPSLDSDLLQGPENSVFCATVASAVAARIAELEKRLTDAERVIDLAEEYIIDGITTAKEQYEMNAPYPAREPGYRAALNDARAAHAAARAYMEGK